MAPSEPHEPGEARELHELHELQELHEPNELVEPREPVGPLEGVRELLPLAVRGDREAVTRVVAAFLPRVYGLCLRIVRNRDLAEEATQETFVRALRALPGLRSPERFRSWLLTIAANTSKELARKRPRTTGLDLDALPFEPADDRGVERRRIAVEAAIGRLGEDERDLFLLHTLEGVPLEDLARDRQVSTGAMKSRVHRIREKVREMAQDHLESQGEIP